MVRLSLSMILKKIFLKNLNEWSLVPGSYHTKISMGLLNLYKTTKKKIYLKMERKY